MKSKCKHGFDVACLMCGFGEFEGKRVWFDWAWQEQQKRIDELESQVKKWKQQSLSAIVHGTCDCGEPWQSIPTNKDGFNQLHCFNCGKDRYENKEVFGDDEPCRHFSTTMFHDGKAECFHCDAVVNEKRQVIGKQNKSLFGQAQNKAEEKIKNGARLTNHKINLGGDE